MSNREKHSFNDKNGKRWTACCECNRGGNGNDEHKCASGGSCDKWNGLGCFIGLAIVGEIKPKTKVKNQKSKERYQRYLSYGDSFNSFLDFCYWDADNQKNNTIY